MQALITLLAGLGFIFVGTQFLTGHMRQAAGPGFRRLVAGATRHPLRAAGVGLAAGAVIQSTNAVTFIVVGLVSAGAITVQAGMPIVTWAAAGSTLRLLLASIDLHAATLVAVATVGAAYLLGYDRSSRHKHWVGAALGLTLLLYGVQLTVQAAVPLRQSETLRAVLQAADQFYLWGFLAGTVLASAIQGQTVSVIAIALAQGGVLGLEQAMLIVIGANLGSGIMSQMQAAGLKGTNRQLAIYQLILKILGCAFLLPVLAVEHYTDLPLMREGLVRMTGDVGLQLTAVHWTLQIAAALIATPLNARLYRLIERASPPSQEEVLSTPQFLRLNAAADADEAIRQAGLEQLRLLRRLPDFLHGVRADEGGSPPPPLSALHGASKVLAGEINGFLREAIRHHPPSATLDRLLKLWNANESLVGLMDALAGFGKALPKPDGDADLAGVELTLAESLHAVLLVCLDELEGGGDIDPMVVELLTDDRSDLMHRLRDDLARRDPPLPPDRRQALWQATDLFEHVTWLLRRYAWNVGTVGNARAPRSAARETGPAAEPALS